MLILIVQRFIMLVQIIIRLLIDGEENQEITVG